MDGTPGVGQRDARLVTRDISTRTWGLRFGTVELRRSGDLLVGNFKTCFIDVFNQTHHRTVPVAP